MDSPLTFLHKPDPPASSTSPLKLDHVLEARVTDRDFFDNAVQETRAAFVTLATTELRPGLSFREALRFPELDVWPIIENELFSKIREDLLALLIIGRILAQSKPSAVALPDAPPAIREFLQARIGTNDGAEQTAHVSRKTRILNVVLNIFVWLLRKRNRINGAIRSFAPRATAASSKTGSPVYFCIEWETGYSRLAVPLFKRFPDTPKILIRGWGWKASAARWLTGGIPEAIIPIDPARPAYSGETARAISAIVQEIRESHLFRRFVIGIGLTGATSLERRLSSLLTVDLLKRILDEAAGLRTLWSASRPSMVVTTDTERPFTRIATHVAGQLNVPILHVPHWDQQIFTPWIDLHASEPGEIRHPLFNELMERPVRIRPLSTTRTILWAAQGSTNENIFGPMLIDAVGGIPSSRLLIRPHPASTSIPIRIMLWSAKVANASRSSGQPILEEIESADVVVTENSIVAFQAILADKPVVILAPGFLLANEVFPFYLKNEAAVLVTDLSRIGEALRHVLENAGVQDTLKRGRKRLRARTQPFH